MREFVNVGHGSMFYLLCIWYLKHEGEERKQRRAGKQKRGLICQIFVGWRLFWDASLLDISGQMVQNASWCGLVFVTDATPDECSLAGWMCNWRENVKKLQTTKDGGTCVRFNRGWGLGLLIEETGEQLRSLGGGGGWGVTLNKLPNSPVLVQSHT